MRLVLTLLLISIICALLWYFLNSTLNLLLLIKMEFWRKKRACIKAGNPRGNSNGKTMKKK
ncbi:unnamed protein product [Moneuplotes crassus]|uniref:Uncharacterized protein n=1 Tax=Euplotes crassus TaxID=5936 RepID=A0AAD1XSF0_EUPCR|nr:unnamed protein product [Moneuplotes crassus]